jgi:lysophospholipase L1-like esterase
MLAKKAIFRILAVGLSALVVCAGGECYLQIREFRTFQAMANQRDLFFEADPFLQIRLKSGKPRSHVNAEGFRGDPLDRAPQTRRIFALGGSSTLTLPLQHDETYPARLEAKLRTRYPALSIQVQNAACDWYTTEHSLIRYLFCIRDLQPDVVIIKHTINDLVRSFCPEWWCLPGVSYRRDYSHYLGPVVRLAQKPIAYRPFRQCLLRREFRQVLAQYIAPAPLDTGAILMASTNRIRLPFESNSIPAFEEFYAHAQAVTVTNFPSLAAYETNLRLLVQILKQDHVQVILETEPSLYRPGLTWRELRRLYFGPLHCAQNSVYPDVASLANGMSLFNGVALKVARELDVPVVDLDRSIPKTLDYFFDDVHPTAKATEIEASLLGAEIVRLEWLANRSRP